MNEFTYKHISELNQEERKEVDAALEKVKSNPGVDSLILLAVSGSLAYGLAKPSSDIDVRGITVKHHQEFLGLKEVAKKPVSMQDPDCVIYELGVFFKLALASNPNIIELLHLNQYEELSNVGKELLENKEVFLSQLARKSYLGFARSQAKEALLHLERFEKGDLSVQKRKEKHLSHTFRILEQGLTLLESKKVEVRVKDTEKFFTVGNLSRKEIEKKFADLEEKVTTVNSSLPEVPNYEEANQLLLHLRKKMHGNSF